VVNILELNLLLKKNFFYLFCLIVTPFLFLMIFGRFGIGDADSGFVVGLGWRIFNGEIAYKDFYYTRPIVSPLLSAFYQLILPEYAQILLIRLVNYFQLLFQVLLTLLALSKFYNFKDLNLNIFIFTIISFLITSIGTMYFQWYTKDAIFFAVLGFFTIVFYEKKLIYLIMGGIFFGASMLTKQNFTLIPIIGLLFTYLEYGTKKTLFVLFGIFLSLLLFYIFLINNDLLEIFIEQNTNSTKWQDIIVTGFLVYFFGHKYLIFYLIITLIIFKVCDYFYFKKKNYNKCKIFFILSYLVLIILNSLNLFYNKSDILIIAFDRLIPILLVIFFSYLFFFKKEKINKHYLLIALVGISWTSSISWGLQTPLMYFTPILFATYYLLQKYVKIFDKKISLLFVIFTICYTTMANTKPYGKDFIWNISQDASSISSKLMFIKSNNNFLKKHSELKKIFKIYKMTTILPSMPGAYYLHSKKNYFSIDWAMDIEAGFDREGLISSLEGCCNYYIVEKKAVGYLGETPGPFYSSVTNYVLNNYTLKNDNYEFFNIYVK